MLPTGKIRKITMNYKDTIKQLLQKDFPTCKISDIRIIARDTDNGISCRINGELFYLSGLLNDSRKAIWKLINE